LFRLPLAAALSVVQLVFTYLVLFVYTRYQEKASRQLSLQPRSEALHSSRRSTHTIFIVTMFVYIFCLLSPLGALIFRFLAETREYIPSLLISLFSDQSGSYFYLSPILVIWNSVKFAFCTVVISTMVGVIIAYRLSRSQRRMFGIIDSLFMMPLGMSAVTLGYGYLISFNRPPFDLRGSWVILVVAHSIVAYPFVVRSVLPVINSMDKNLKDAAKLLGASQSRIFLSIELPIILPSILVGATFAFAVSMGEFGSSLMLLRPENATIPIAIFKFLGLPGEANLGRALAMSGLLMVIVSLGFVAIEKFRFKGSSAF
jgi:thiamine transport system permease protein